MYLALSTLSNYRYSGLFHSLFCIEPINQSVGVKGLKTQVMIMNHSFIAKNKVDEPEHAFVFYTDKEKTQVTIDIYEYSAE